MKLAIVTYHTPNCASYAQLSDISKQKYAEKYGYAYFLHTTPFNDRQPTWNKPEALLSHFNDAQILVWMDADAIIANYQFDIASVITDKDIYMSKDVNGWNAGVFAVRTSDISKRFLQSVITGYQQFKYARFKQQSCMGYLEDTSFAQYVCQVPAKIWNCYDPIYPQEIDNPFKAGDFILHLPNQKYLNKIHPDYRKHRFQSILNGQPVTVLHRGKCGDLIALCAWLREHHSNQKAHIYIKEHRSFHKDSVDWIAPLLLEQPYIEKVGICQKLSDVQLVNDVPCDLKLAREEAKRNSSYTAWWVDEAKWWQEVGAVRNETDLRDRVPMAYNELLMDNSPWLKVPDCQPYIKEPYIVVSVTPRYGCMSDLSPVKVLADQYRIIFLGQQHNWLASGASSYSQFCNAKTAIQHAQLIRDCSLFIGTQTLQTWLAQSQGIDRIVSISPKFRDTILRVEKGFKTSISNKQELQEALYKWKEQRA